MAWAIYPLSATDESILEDPQWESYYGGPGQPYAKRASIRRGKSFTLVRQFFGLDV